MTDTTVWSLLRRLHNESVETGQLGSYGRAYGGSKLWLEVRDALDWHDKQQDEHPDDWRDRRVITSASGQGC